LVGGVSVYCELCVKVEGGLLKWAIFLYGRFVRGNWSGLLDWRSKRIRKKALENGTSPLWGLVLKPGRGPIYQGLTCVRRLWR
jgi:hypothetical protein